MYTYYPFLSHISNDHCISFGHGPELCSPTATRAQWLWGLAPRVVAARGIPDASQRSALGARCEAQQKWVKAHGIFLGIHGILMG